MLRGCELVCGVGKGIGRRREQSLSLRNNPSFSEVSLD